MFRWLIVSAIAASLSIAPALCQSQAAQAGKTDRAIWYAGIGLAGAIAYDLWTSRDAGRRGYLEANWPKSAAGQVAVNAGIFTASYLALRKVRGRAKWFALAPIIVYTALHIYAGEHNRRLP